MVELKYFGGLNDDEIAEVLKISSDDSATGVEICQGLAPYGISLARRDENNEARMTKGEGMTKSEDRNALDEDSCWGDGAGLVREEPETKRIYDLEEQTARFGEAIIDFAKAIPQTPVTNRIISQLIGAATSVGANYVEADDAVSKRNF